MKRGQVTIFIIVGIVILSLLIIFFFVAKKPILKLQNPSTVKEFTESCLETTLQKSIEINGKDGNIENINKFIRLHFKECLDFSSFKTMKIEIEEIESVSTQIYSTKAITNVVMPITITQKQNIIKYPEFSASISLTCSSCIPIAVDASCNAIESKLFSACGLSKQFNIGDSLKINGECLAC